MAEHPKEVREITETADALMLNLGNITDARMESMMISAKEANRKGIPMVLDLVGIACSSLRREYIRELLKAVTPTVLKGNYSEIQALYSDAYRSSGVDAEATLDVPSVSKAAVDLANKYQTIILASGKTDIVTDGKRLIYIHNGTQQLSTVTGTGCMQGALCAAYLSADPGMDAAVSACAVLGICGQLAGTEKGSGSFMVNLMDALSTLADRDILKYLDMEEKKLEEL